ncbi:site-specific integrase [Oryzibacter oryziterrae]|uniref:site-specific integrase n=1 Tax=Oryzibacter oryziterrae TaxID=2766474 RepID=UPI001F2FEA22|nr:site-specific integrase [Oryzibacter oryziterrae]
MNQTHSFSESAIPQTSEATEDIDEQRHAAWLLSPYSAPEWRITDSNDPNHTADISFAYRLADGNLLTECHQLYATVKEYAWWMRDPRFTKIDDAVTHAALVRNLMHIVHALTLRGIYCFKHLVPFDIVQLIEECRYGTDAVLHASERIEKHLEGLKASGLPLPKYTSPKGHTSNYVWVEKLLADSHLPEGTARCLPRVTWLIARAAKASGLDMKSFQAGNLPPFRNQTSPVLGRWLDPLESLWTMRRHMNAESITFKPFPLGAAKVAAIKGIAAERTPIPPPKLALHLVEQAARRVLERSNTGTRATALPWPEIVKTATACWIILATFTARRDREIDELTEDCLAGDDAGGWWLHIYVEKTLQRKEWIPIPRIAAQAVRLLLSISNNARKESGRSLIFLAMKEGGSTVQLDVGQHLDEFAAAAGVPLHQPRGGLPQAWHWTPHQMRRLFATLYFYRHDGATIEVLSHQLRHFSMEMTRRYVTLDAEAAAIWQDTEMSYRSNFARSIAAGERAVGGPMGERLKKVAARIIGQFRRKMQVVSPDRAGASLFMFMERERLVLTPKPWVTCSCPLSNDAARKAVCRQEDPNLVKAKGPDFSNAGPLTCHKCPFAIVEGSRTATVCGEVEHLQRALKTSNHKPTLFEDLERLNLIQISNAYEVTYSSARPLEPALADKEASE